MFENYKIKKLTKNLGTIEETSNYILCEVNNEQLTKLMNEGLLIIDTERLKDKYGINKSIIFNITNYNFNDGLFLITDASINFNNCKFKDNVFVKTAKRLVFNENTYINSSNTYKHSDRYMDISHTDKVVFLNETINNPVPFLETSMKVSANEIRFINSQVFKDEISSSNLQAKKLQLVNSKIDGYSTFIKAPSITTDNTSYIGPKRSIIIDTNTEMDPNTMSAEQVIINGERQNNSKNKRLIKQQV